MSDLPYRPCVGVMLVNAEGRVFLGQRRDRTEPAWQMPQGGIDPGEDAVQAGLRELHEEIGVPPDLVTLEARTDSPLTYDLPDDLIGRAFGGKYRGQAQDWLLLRFNGSDSDIDLETAHPEFSAWRWADPDTVLAEIVPFKAEVYARVLDQFRSKL